MAEGGQTRGSVSTIFEPRDLFRAPLTHEDDGDQRMSELVEDFLSRLSLHGQSLSAVQHSQGRQSGGNGVDALLSARPYSGPSLPSAGSNAPQGPSSSRQFTTLPASASRSATNRGRNTNPQRFSGQGQHVGGVRHTPIRSSPFATQPQPSGQPQRPPNPPSSSQVGTTNSRHPQRLLMVSTPDEEEEVACPICTESRRYLKELPCKHRFCEYCVQRIVNQQETNPSRNFPCPFCRAVTPIPDRGASDFPISTTGNTQFLQLEEVAGTLSRVRALQEDSTGRCEDCGEENSRYTCVQCQKEVCGYCRHDHHQHPLLLLSSTDSLILHNEQASLHCHSHPSKAVRVFCSTCNQPLCDICQRGAHAQHDLQDLSQAAASAREFLRKTESGVKRGLRLLHVAQEHVEKDKRSALQEISKSEQTIRSRAAEARAVIDQYEKETLSTLKDRRVALKRKREQELNQIQDKISGMSAMLNHMEQVMLSDKEADLIQMHVSARDTIGKDGFLDKYTTDLPFYRYNVDMTHETFARFTEVVKLWIGIPAISVSQSAADIVEVVADVPLNLNNKESMTPLSVCPVGDQNAWVAYQHSSSAGTTLGLCNLDTGRVSRLFPVDGPVFLVKIDQGLALATFRNRQAVLVLEGKHEMLPSEVKHHKILFAKGELRACLQVTPARLDSNVWHTNLVAHVETAQDVFKASKEVVKLSGLQDPQQMDMSSDGKLFVVVDKNQTIHFFKPGATKAHMVLRVEDNSKVLYALSDVCFYRLGGQEVLLLADPFQNDVLVLNVSKSCCSFLGFLTNLSGSLQHPSALNVDSTNGSLVVTCKEMSIVVCGDTGAQMDESTGWVPTRLKTKSPLGMSWLF